MKTKLLISTMVLFPALSALGQVPQGFNYQAIARDASGDEITNTTLQVQISVLSDTNGFKATGAGNYIWEEQHGVTTNGFGLFSLVIGNPSATKIQGSASSFSTIDWKIQPVFIGTKIYYLGDWKILGSSRLWSVPFAMYSKDVETKQQLSLGGLNLSISGGNSVSLPAGSNVWQTDGTNIFRTTGNVGIGTTLPTSLLQVGDNSGAGSAVSVPKSISVGNEWGNGTAGTNFKLKLYDTPTASNTYGMGVSSGLLEIVSGSGGSVGVFTNGATERMRISNSGYVGIGTTSPAFRLDVAGRARLQYGPGGTAGVWFTNAANTENRSFLGMYDDNNIGIFGSGLANWGFIMNLNNGNLGLGTTSPGSKMVIQPPATWADDLPLFEVKNKYGYSVLAVYNNGVRILVEDPDGKGGLKSGFAIGGFDQSKAGETYNLMMVSPDSVRFNIDNTENAKTGLKGGFAIGGFDATKASLYPRGFMEITPQASEKGQYNTFVGYHSGLNNTSTGNRNTFMGYESGLSNTSGDYNVYIGNSAGSGGNGSYNVYIGDKAGTLNSGNYNTFIGKGTGEDATGVSWSTYLGFGAGASVTTADYNTILGSYSGAFTTTGDENTFVGTFTGNLNQTGSGNTYVGHYAGETVTGSGNVLIGCRAGENSGAINNTLYINNNAGADPLIWGDFEDNLLRIYGYLAVGRDPNVNYSIVCDGGTSPQYSLRVYKGAYADGNGFVSSSDIRLKKDIEPLDGVLDKVKLLRGVEYSWRSEEFPERSLPDGRQVGLISQDVESVFPGLVTEDEEGYKGIAYGRVSAVLVEAIKEQQVIIESQNKKIARLEEMVKELKLLIEGR